MMDRDPFLDADLEPGDLRPPQVLNPAERERLERSVEMLRAECTAALNRLLGTRRVRYDLEAYRAHGIAYAAAEAIASEFPDEVNLALARKNPEAYLRLLDRTTTQRTAAEGGHDE